MLIPTVIEQTNMGERAYDIYSRLLKDRIIFVGSDIEPQSANLIVAQLLHLAHESDSEEIYMYINSPGGEIYSGLAILDTMRYIKPKITTISVGLAASFAAVLLAAGEKGRRFSLPNSRIMIHQPHGGVKGQALDIEVNAREIIDLKRKVEEMMAEFSGQPIKAVAKDMDRDFFMTPEQAKKYGLIDAVIKDAGQVLTKK